MPLLEFHRIGKPADRVTERADRKLNEDLSISRRVLVVDDRFALLPHFDAEAHEVAFHAVDATGLQLGLKQDVARIEIGKPYAPRMLLFREDDATAVVEVEANARRMLLRRHFGRCWIGTLLGRCRSSTLRSRRRFRRGRFLLGDILLDARYRNFGRRRLQHLHRHRRLNRGFNRPRCTVQHALRHFALVICRNDLSIRWTNLAPLIGLRTHID